MSRRLALFQAHVAVLFMGITAVIAEISGFEPWRTTAYRVSLGGLVLIVLWFLRTPRRRPDLRKLALFFGLGMLLAFHWFAFFRSIRLLGVLSGCALIGLEPLFIAIAAALFLGERISRIQKLSLFLSLSGFALLGSSGGLDQPFWVQGVLWALFAYASFALLTLANRVLVQRESPLLLTAVEMLGATPLALFMTPSPWLPTSFRDLGFALFFGILCTGLAWSLYNASMRVLSSPVVGLLLSLEVVYGMLGGWLLGESLAPVQAIALVLIANILLLDLWSYGVWRWRVIRGKSPPPPDLPDPCPAMPRIERDSP